MKVHFTSPLLIGGAESQMGGADRRTIRRPDGTPELSISALRGAWRIELEGLLGKRACSPAGIDGGEALAGDCPLDPICPVCRAFGNARRPGLLRIDSIELGGEQTMNRYRQVRSLQSNPEGGEPTGHGYTTLQRVAINRHRHKAEDEHLFSYESTEPGLELSFDVRLSWHGDQASLAELWPSLRGAACAIEAIGGGRAVGYGSCRIECEDPPRTIEPLVQVSETASSFSIVLHLEQPVCIGVRRAASNVIESRRFIPGSALRGALATAILRANGQSFDSDPAFQQLISKAARFGDGRYVGRFALTTGPTVEIDELVDAKKRPIPVPFSARTCKQFPGALAVIPAPAGQVRHGLFDTLLLRGAQEGFSEASIARLLDTVCPTCGGKVVRASGGLVMHEVAVLDPPLGSVTRTALSRRTGRAADSMLFTLQTLAANAVFVARIRNLAPAAAALVAQLSGQSIELGTARSRGLGRCRIQLARPAPGNDPWRDKLGSVGQRFAQLNRAWDELINLLCRTTGCDAPGRDQYVFSLDLVGEGLLDLSAESGLLSPGIFGLGEPCRILKSFVEYQSRRGYDDLRQERKPQRLAAQPGSTILFAVDKSAVGESELIDTLATIEREGVGSAQHEGFGEVIVCHPFHAVHCSSLI